MKNINVIPVISTQIPVEVLNLLDDLHKAGQYSWVRIYVAETEYKITKSMTTYYTVKNASMLDGVSFTKETVPEFLRVAFKIADKSIESGKDPMGGMLLKKRN